MEEHHYSVNHVFLHVVEDGPANGKPIIFLHGFPEFWYGWKNQIPYFSSKGYRVIVPDQRGYNLSDKPHNVADYTLEVLTNDIAELISTATSGKVFLVGHDWGGIVAFSVAEKYPELVEKLVVLNAPHPSVMKNLLSRNFEQMIKSWYAMFFQMPFIPEFVLSYKNFAFLRSMIAPGGGHGLTNTNEISQYLVSWQKARSVRSMLNWYRAAKLSSKEHYGKIMCPTLILWGKKDPSLVSEIAQENLSFCPNGKVQYLEEATHWLQHERPLEVNHYISEFLA